MELWPRKKQLVVRRLADVIVVYYVSAIGYFAMQTEKYKKDGSIGKDDKHIFFDVAVFLHFFN